MIRYALQCDGSHHFESWFRDSESYETQSLAGHVSCPICGSAAVEKALMAPAVQTARAKAVVKSGEPPPQGPSPEPSLPVALGDEPNQRLRAMMRAFRDHVMATSNNVGPAFASEARKIHDGEAIERPIHGEANADEVRALLDDGIEVMPMPVFPDERN